MESNVITFRARSERRAADCRADIQVARIQSKDAPQPVTTSHDLVRLTKTLIVRLRDGRFNQRATTYRELDAIARMIERESGVAPGTWV